jgi:hypothetical protein
MATYATEAQLRDYCADNSDAVVPGDSDAVERLLERSERRLDGLVGPRALDATTGLKFVPASLTAVQTKALARATCAVAEHELTVGPGVLIGDDDFLGEGVVLLRQATRQPLRALEELAGTGLLTYSGCAAPTLPTAA